MPLCLCPHTQISGHTLTLHSNMRTFITTTIILFIITEVWTAEAASSVKRPRKKRAWIVDSLPLSFNLEEEHDGVFPYTLGQLNVEKDSLPECFLSGPGVDEEPMDIFQLNKNRAVIEVNEKVDYEKNKNFTLTLKCTSSENVHMRLEVEIQVLDVNDNAPVFDKASYETSVGESTPQGTDLVTVRALDQDDSSTGNGLFTFTILSVSPQTSNLEFFINQQSQTGRISFRGCLDYEEAQKYTIVVEAKDHGEHVQQSSTATVTVNIIDSNDHKPELSVKTGSGRVKERENGVVVYRLEIKDEDHRGSAGWRAKYTLHGEKEKNFKIETDLTTNDGIISVVSPLDFEESPELTLSVSVENEEPLFSCKVKQRRSGSLWDVDYFRDVSSSTLLSFPITITVEDVNDPPELTHAVEHVTVMENATAGQILWTFTATDQDSSSPAGFRFFKGEDVDNWVTVNSETGQVSTVKVLDRESPFVKDSVYTITMYVADKGEPPMTGTGTLVIHLLDQNDNLPVLEVNTLSMCLSDTVMNITAVDLDLPPFSGPFNYELLGDVKEKWRIEPSIGTTVSLVKDSSVHSGHYDLRVKIADSKGKFSVQHLTVSVYNCSIAYSGRSGKGPTVQLGFAAIAVILISVLLVSLSTRLCLSSYQYSVILRILI
ncbi:cadherin-like protein 26 [Colossoma macropomum]|uniref:cadherin-like protein 26 n=1 Tax=Colossoma macropomum TaxID=42526 RepID=UPI0018653F6E|nr:cadherin-like protein 26 [Colossoma macropomum]